MGREAKSPLVFVEPGVKINSHYYVERILNDGLLPWAEAEYGEDNWSFTQDGAPSHTSKMTQEWLKKKNSSFLDKNLWPPSSPDINPLDFCLWSVLEDKACKKNYKNVDDLKRGLKAAWADLSIETVRAAVDAVPKRLRAIIRAKGGHIE